MRDIKRIAKILEELEQIWKENPDYRLGQLLVVAVRPTSPAPQIFNIEDEDLMLGLKRFANKETNIVINETKPYWERYPNVSKIDPSQITLELVESYINVLKEENNQIVITPRILMKLNGAPIEDRSWIDKQTERIDKLKSLLSEIEKKAMIIEIQKGYKIASA